MARYRMAGSIEEEPDGEQLIYATLPAQPETYILYVNKDRTTSREPVIGWGILDNGSAVPLTISGVWDGVTANRNQCVLYPDGSCGKLDESWRTFEAAIEELCQYGE